VLPNWCLDDGAVLCRRCLPCELYALAWSEFPPELSSFTHMGLWAKRRRSSTRSRPSGWARTASAWTASSAPATPGRTMWCDSTITTDFEKILYRV
jgi:hypothetical protein